MKNILSLKFTTNLLNRVLEAYADFALFTLLPLADYFDEKN